MIPHPDLAALYNLLEKGGTGRVVVVAAHPDDETIGLGPLLARFSALTLFHATDGAPRDPRFSLAAGFPDPARYAAARRNELLNALAELDVRGANLVSFGASDQAAGEWIAELTARLIGELSGAEAVFTHPYEGGHPDHDTCAFAVQLAAAELGEQGPRRFEFASYHAEGGRFVSQKFWSQPDAPEVKIEFAGKAGGRRRRALASFSSQVGLAKQFPADAVSLRLAPHYDFTVPPAPGWAYDGFGLAITGEQWLRQVTELTAKAPMCGGSLSAIHP